MIKKKKIRPANGFLTVLLGVLLLTAPSCQNEMHRTEKASAEGQTIVKNKEPLLIGPIGPEALREAPYSQWFDENYQSYDVNEAMLPSLTSLLKGIDIRIFMGTWCEDSQTYVPQFLKILEQTDYPGSKVRIIAVDQDKVEPRNSLYGYRIEYVPTFIFFKGDKELGRIVEVPETGSLEKDMARILTSD